MLKPGNIKNTYFGFSSSRWTKELWRKTEAEARKVPTGSCKIVMIFALQTSFSCVCRSCSNAAIKVIIYFISLLLGSLVCSFLWSLPLIMMIASASNSLSAALRSRALKASLSLIQDRCSSQLCASVDVSMMQPIRLLLYLWSMWNSFSPPFLFRCMTEPRTESISFVNWKRLVPLFWLPLCMWRQRNSGISRLSHSRNPGQLTPKFHGVLFIICRRRNGFWNSK